VCWKEKKEGVCTSLQEPAAEVKFGISLAVIALNPQVV
jgi:hypothetical protein